MPWSEVGGGSQRATQSGGNAASFSQAFPGDVTAGSLLIAFGWGWRSLHGGPLPVNVSDTLGTVYAVVYTGGMLAGSGDQSNFLAYGIAPSSGPNTVQIDQADAVASFTAWAINEFSGIHPLSPLLDTGADHSTLLDSPPPHADADGVEIAWSLGDARQWLAKALAFRPAETGDALIVGVMSYIYPATTISVTSPAVGIGGTDLAAFSVAITSGGDVTVPSTDEADFSEDDGFTTEKLTWIEHHGDTPHAFAETPLNDRASYHLGFKAGTVLQWARITRGLSDYQGRLEHASAGAVFSDTDRYWRDLVDSEFLPNRPQLYYMIDDERRRLEGVPRLVFNGFCADYAPEQDLTFRVTSCDWLKKTFTRNRRSQQKWQPLIREEDFDVNTTPQDVLNRPGPVVYGRLSDEDEQTVSDSSRATGYLPDPASVTPSATGSPANPVTKRFYFTGLNAIYGDPMIRPWSDHRGETYYISVDQEVPDEQEIRDQGHSGTASVYVEFEIACDDAAAVRVYMGDEHGENIVGLGYAEPMGGSPDAFVFSYGRNPSTGDPLVPVTFPSKPPLRNNTYIPGTLTGGNVTTDTGSGAYALVYTGLRLCPDDVYRCEFLAACNANKDILSVYQGGVRLSDAEVAANFLVPATTEWDAVWPQSRYIAVNGRRYSTVYVDRAYAIAQGLVTSNELGQGDTLLTINLEGIETVGDGTGTLITSPVLQAQHFAQNPGNRPWNAQGWVNTAPFTFSARPDLELVDRTSFAAVSALVNKTAAIVFGFKGEEIGSVDALARWCVSYDFDLGFNRKGQLIATYEPSSVPADVQTFTDVINITERSCSVRDEVGSLFFNVIPYRWGPDYSGRTRTTETVVRGQRIVVKDAGGWQSVAEGEDDVRDATSITNYDQDVARPVLDMHAVRDAATASDVLDRVLTRYKNPLRIVQFTVPLSGTSVDLGDVFKVSSVEGISASGWTDRALRCIRHELDPNNLTVTVTAYDLDRVLNA